MPLSNTRSRYPNTAPRSLWPLGRSTADRRSRGTRRLTTWSHVLINSAISAHRCSDKTDEKERNMFEKQKLKGTIQKLRRSTTLRPSAPAPRQRLSRRFWSKRIRATLSFLTDTPLKLKRCATSSPGFKWENPEQGRELARRQGHSPEYASGLFAVPMDSSCTVFQSSHFTETLPCVHLVFTLAAGKNPLQ